MNANLLYVKEMTKWHGYSTEIYVYHYYFHFNRKDQIFYEITKNWFPPIKPFPNIRKS